MPVAPPSCIGCLRGIIRLMLKKPFLCRMRMLFNVLVLTLAAAPVPSMLVAQTITLSPAPFEDYTFDNLRIIGQDAGGFFMLESNLPLDLDRDRVGFRNRKYKIAYYRHTLAQAWVTAVDASPSQASVDAVAFANEKIIAVSTLFDKGESSLRVHARWIDNQGRPFRDQSVGVFRLAGNEYDKLQLVVSGNQRLLAFVVTEHDGNFQRMHFMLADSTFTVLKQKAPVIPYDEKSFTPEEYALSDNGDLHVLGVRSVKTETSGRKREEDFLLYACPLAADTLHAFTVGAPGFDITSASMAFDNLNDRLLVTGFYADKASSAGAGVMLATLDMKDPQTLVFRSSPIDNQTQLKILGERNRSYDIGLINYPIRKIVLRSDGGAVIIAEAFFANDYSYYDYFTQSYTRSIEYHFNNVVTVSINADGSIHWLNVVRKNQVSTDDGGNFSSFCPVLTESAFVLVYNADVSRDNEVTTARITASGKKNETGTIRTPNNLLLYSRSGKQISANEAVFPCISKKKLMLAKITF